MRRAACGVRPHGAVRCVSTLTLTLALTMGCAGKYLLEREKLVKENKWELDDRVPSAEC